MHSDQNIVRQFVEAVSALSLPMRLCVDAVIGRQFLFFAEAPNRLPDRGSARDQYLRVHADFNWHHKLQMHRRLNFLLYLTPQLAPRLAKAGDT